MFIENIKLSQQGKEHLIKLKRVTKLKHWNELCRWALCTSLAEPTSPPAVRIPLDSSVEMSWKVFGGEYADIYEALVRARCLRDGLEPTDEVLADQFRLHLHRGIGYLFADKEIQEIENLLQRVPGLKP